ENAGTYWHPPYPGITCREPGHELFSLPEEIQRIYRTIAGPILYSPSYQYSQRIAGGEQFNTEGNRSFSGLRLRGLFSEALQEENRVFPLRIQGKESTIKPINPSDWHMHESRELFNIGGKVALVT